VNLCTGSEGSQASESQASLLLLFISAILFDSERNRRKSNIQPPNKQASPRRSYGTSSPNHPGQHKTLQDELLIHESTTNPAQVNSVNCQSGLPVVCGSYIDEDTCQRSVNLCTGSEGSQASESQASLLLLFISAILFDSERNRRKSNILLAEVYCSNLFHTFLRLLKYPFNSVEESDFTELSQSFSTTYANQSSKESDFCVNLSKIRLNKSQSCDSFCSHHGLQPIVHVSV